VRLYSGACAALPAMNFRATYELYPRVTPGPGVYPPENGRTVCSQTRDIYPADPAASLGVQAAPRFLFHASKVGFFIFLDFDVGTLKLVARRLYV
jgi:hypothetical protein